MHITNYQDLESQGVSQEEIKTALEINYFGKKFRREIHIPKSFSEKINNLATELEQQNVNYFITETNFSYTLWQEIQDIQLLERVKPTVIQSTTAKKTNFTSPNLDYQPTRLTEPREDISSIPVIDNENQNRISSSLKLSITKENKANDNNKSVDTTDSRNNNSQSEKIIKYRGIPVSDNKTKAIAYPKKKKRRTYRGVVYED